MRATVVVVDIAAKAAERHAPRSATRGDAQAAVADMSDAASVAALIDDVVAPRRPRHPAQQRAFSALRLVTM
ncbi:MAG: hypothetical protein U0W40_11370 [Acidimicrobiia bacterium]